LDHKGLERNSYEIKPFENAIQEAVYYNKGKKLKSIFQQQPFHVISLHIFLEHDERGLWHAAIVDSYLIDFYIPFLPLERTHIKMCIKAELTKYEFEDKESYEKLHLKKDAEQIADELKYEPAGFNKYSSSGCKRVPNLVRNLIVEKKHKLVEKTDL
jgi:hypothetical protein